MYQILRDLGKRFLLLKNATAVVVFLCVVVNAEPIQKLDADTLENNMDVENVVEDFSSDFLEEVFSNESSSSSEMEMVSSSAQIEISSSSVASSSSRIIESSSAQKKELPTKNVLYLSGGKNSPWFHLGVLYAIENYGTPIDSIVATSWGAYIGYLWAKGISLDDIQRIFLDEHIAPFLGQEIAQNEEQNFDKIPFSKSGLPSLNRRFAWENSGFKSQKIAADTFQLQQELFAIKLREFLYRTPKNFEIPFAVLNCNGLATSSFENVMNALPLYNNAASGEVCPLIALPLEDSENETALMSIALPIRENEKENFKDSLLKADALLKLQNQPGILIRAHTINDSSKNAWIQAGFSSFERRLSEILNAKNEKKKYTHRTLKKSIPFYFNSDSLTAQTQDALSAYWNETDKNFSAIEDFSSKVLATPFYDSLKFTAENSGAILPTVQAKTKLDLYAGGFGSNAIGPNAYVGANLFFVDHMEFALSLQAFYGMHSYGIFPSLEISKFWLKNLSFNFAYNFYKITPLKSYFSDLRKSEKVLSKTHSDLNMAVSYAFDERQKVSLHFLFGERIFELSPEYYRESEFETYPVSPQLRYTYGDSLSWFSQNGFSFEGSVAMQSIGYSYGHLGQVIPIYWKVFGALQYNKSPFDFLSLGASLSGGVDFYHNEGYGYTFPKSFEYSLINNFYRQQVQATPWSLEWENSDLMSHGYVLTRANLGVHYKGNGAWIFAAFFHDFEGASLKHLNKNRFVLEPALRLKKDSFEVYAGISRIVDTDHFGDFLDIKNYKYFIRIGNYDF